MRKEIEQMEKDVVRCGGVERTVEEIHRYAALAGEILNFSGGYPGGTENQKDVG